MTEPTARNRKTDEVTSRQVENLSREAKTKMQALGPQILNGQMAMALQLCLMEFETLKAMLFADGGPLAGRDLEFAHAALTAFNEWADNTASAITRNKLLGRSNGTPLG